MDRGLSEALFPYFQAGEFRQRTALVTGGSRGIGRAIARGLALLGADLVVGYHQDRPSALALQNEIVEQGGHCLLVQGDVSDRSTLKEMAGQALDHFGRIDILINNAGLLRDSLFLFLKEEDWDRVVNVNLKGVYWGCQAVVKTMIGQRFGRIINLTSPSALLGRAAQTNYAAAKGGVISFTRSLARELAHSRVTVNTLLPGVIRTDMFEGLPEKVRLELNQQIHAGRPGTPEEVVGAALFLASPRSGYITGQIMAVDGGLT